MRKPLKIAAGISALLVLGIQLIQPDRGNPAVTPERAIKAHVQVPEAVEGILRRACRDCHSNETRWPWYAKVSPVSFFMADHVKDGRRRLNFSEWDQVRGSVAGESTAKRLESICEEVSEGKMPLRSYLFLHPEARLSSDDQRLICDWAKAGGKP